ncbi:RNA methyltransferase [Bifidobacterium sp. UTCIF-3]|uniref:16S rRNA (guanine(966)-N(2))-methyltransferase RsmD n=1 Tax=unclassified Bifidobacterium TaxID=2608897 RepID=UPI0015E475A8|nr:MULTISPECIES: 16S rRNA (guanine(966)-N(2))-methyltransferase RsmD [unclassified Bifidobacterium]TPF78990.1 RNA methyltransferase [Bifidobacterium sp. UTCIF-1]TPF82891.1 RNA methyltransferase [Bifidobacterium sp. UTCIF-3]TPF83931.1 RNA methyltransferase [Bifidobacterium sp. UTCIF-36]
MRVISGRFKGVALATPKTGTRPTTDRTKEAIFSHLDSWGVLDGARVLDLFAGTGALGIEALSRGARELVAVESSRPAAALISKTLADLKRNRSWSADLNARVLVKKAETVAGGFGEPFGVIFIDPPYAYGTDECNQLLADLATGDATNERTVIMLERSIRSDDPAAPEGWAITERRNYGETAVFYIEPIAESADTAEQATEASVVAES